MADMLPRIELFFTVFLLVKTGADNGLGLCQFLSAMNSTFSITTYNAMKLMIHCNNIDRLSVWCISLSRFKAYIKGPLGIYFDRTTTS